MISPGYQLLLGVVSHPITSLLGSEMDASMPRLAAWPLIAALAIASACGNITVVEDEALADAGAGAVGGAAGAPGAAGCSATRSCDEDRICNVVTGACVECLIDADCSSGKHPRCDVTRFVCIKCESEDDDDDCQ